MRAVGEIRPGQLMYTFGIGATLDLPEFSVLVLGLDFWERDQCPPIIEYRLLAAVQEIVGSQVMELRLPPTHDENDGNDSAGIPVVPYPRWMRCTRCGVMAPLDQGIFDKKEDYINLCAMYIHTAKKRYLNANRRRLFLCAFCLHVPLDICPMCPGMNSCMMASHARIPCSL